MFRSVSYADGVPWGEVGNSSLSPQAAFERWPPQGSRSGQRWRIPVVGQAPRAQPLHLSHSLPQSRAHQGTSTVQDEPVPLLLCWHWAWDTTKSKEKKGKEKGEWEGGGWASSALLLIHFSAFNHSKAVTSSAPGSLYLHKRKAIPFRRRPWVIDLMLNVMFGSAALSAPSHGKLMFPTNSAEWYSAFLKMKCWGLGVKGRDISAFILGLQDTFWVMMKGKPARN